MQIKNETLPKVNALRHIAGIARTTKVNKSQLTVTKSACKKLGLTTPETIQIIYWLCLDELAKEDKTLKQYFTE